MADHVLVVVFDGLRPDMVRPDTTPALLRLLGRGTRFVHARSVFPSETRVCTASLVTGCWPRRHGLVANRFAHPTHPDQVVETGQQAALLALAEATGPLLGVPTLGERLAVAGRDCAVVSSGSTGQCHVLNPRAAVLDQVSLSAHGAAACSPRGRVLLETLPPPPHGAPARVAWAAEAARRLLRSAPPALTILWLSEPDTSAHYDGLGSRANLDALRAADAAFGRLLDDIEAGPRGADTAVLVASDHGHTTVAGHVDVAAALATEPSLAGWRVLAGSSGGLLPPAGHAEDGIAAAARWLMRQDWAGHVIATQTGDLPQGVLPHDAVLVDHPRTAPVLFTLRAGPASTASGLSGTSLLDGTLADGAGTHGGLSLPELRILLGLAGPGLAAGVTSEWPAGLVDVAPTVLALLGVPGDGMDGRVLTEAFPAAPAIVHARSPESWQAARPGYGQSLARMRLGPHVWLDQGRRF